MAVPYDQLNTAAVRDIAPGVVDLVFRNDPLLAKFKTRTEVYPGGVGWQETILYGKMPGGPYKKGQPLSTEQRQTITGMTFTPRYYDVPVALYLEDLEVENAGPSAIIKLADLKLQEAALNMSARLAVAQYWHGQNVGTDRTAHINGIAEAVNDGTTNSWMGSAFTTYGGVTRTDVGTALNAGDNTQVPFSVGGPITYDTLEFSYNACVRGDKHPDIGVTTNYGMSLIKSAFQPQQRLEGTDPAIGFATGLKFNQAVIFQSQYAPGKYGVNDADLGNYSASAGETFHWITTDVWKFVVVGSKLFAFGFTGFMPSQSDSSLVGHYKFGGNLVCVAPPYNYPLYGITA